ncbi:hypothetical protein R3W88_033768 [Solanum pinnatisectum]|uniref:RNase H type-1 domain-containing protein n=1 Tax=Solanum pinnatisectum TaxID=50273 RepID=A0AAV9K0D9_9SOLN|nr:hypothetical protein R3W88_033768 [Solanum pinnatisectum]
MARPPTSISIVIEPYFATKWFSPSENIFKCNIDASRDVASGITGVNMLVQNSHGSFIKGRSSKLCRQDDPLMAKTLGVRKALIWLQQQLIATLIIIEMDNLLGIQVLERDCGNNSYFDVLI